MRSPGTASPKIARTVELNNYRRGATAWWLRKARIKGHVTPGQRARRPAKKESRPLFHLGVQLAEEPGPGNKHLAELKPGPGGAEKRKALIRLIRDQGTGRNGGPAGAPKTMATATDWPEMGGIHARAPRQIFKRVAPHFFRRRSMFALCASSRPSWNLFPT